MSFQYCATFVTPVTITATTSTSGYPAANAADRTLPFAEWRSSSIASDQSLTFDAGTEQPLAFIALYGSNCPIVRVRTSLDASDFTTGLTGYTSNTLWTVAQETELGLYNLFAVPTAPMSTRAVRIVHLSTSTPVDGLNVFRLGTLFWGTSLTTLTKPPKPMDITYDDNYQRERLANGRTEKLRKGHRFMQFTMTQSLEPAYKAEWDAVKLLGERMPVLWFWNLLANKQDVYWAEYEGEVRGTKHGFYDEMTMTWRTKI